MMIPINSARIIILYFHRYQKESKGIARQPGCDIIANGIVYQQTHGTVTIDACLPSPLALDYQASTPEHVMCVDKIKSMCSLV